MNFIIQAKTSYAIITASIVASEGNYNSFTTNLGNLNQGALNYAACQQKCTENADCVFSRISGSGNCLLFFNLNFNYKFMRKTSGGYYSFKLIDQIMQYKWEFDVSSA